MLRLVSSGAIRNKLVCRLSYLELCSYPFGADIQVRHFIPCIDLKMSKLCLLQLSFFIYSELILFETINTQNLFGQIKLCNILSTK